MIKQLFNPQTPNHKPCSLVSQAFEPHINFNPTLLTLRNPESPLVLNSQPSTKTLNPKTPTPEILTPATHKALEEIETSSKLAQESFIWNRICDIRGLDSVCFECGIFVGVVEVSTLSCDCGGSILV